MLKVFSGAFHPGLENEFRSFLPRCRSNPFSACLVVVPSSRIRERLMGVLAKDGVSYVGVHFHTFSSLPLAMVTDEDALPKPLFSDSLFYDSLIKKIIKEDRPFEAMEDMAVPEGFPPAVRGTLRDMLDAGIDAENVQLAIQEEFAGKDVDLGTLRSLLRLHTLYLKKLATLPLFSHTDVLKLAILKSSTSPFLNQFEHVIFYGFYDMTGLQSDLFQSVVKNHPSSLFFPYRNDDPSYGFSKRFRDNFLQPVIQSETQLETPKRNQPYAVVNVSGLQGEAWYVATQIERLVAEKKWNYSDLAVVARSEDRLVPVLPTVFSEYGIPYKTSASESIGNTGLVVEALRALDDSSDLRELDVWPSSVEKALAFLSAWHTPLTEDGKMLWEAMLTGVRQLTSFEMLGGRVSKREFLEGLRDRWNRIGNPNAKVSASGVSLLHAEAARGLSFKAVFMIGMEEKVFPRILREDPFLRDDARLALNQTLGHKISQKMTALEEERLLFEIITQSAEEHLAFVYQRSDNEGAVVGASSFLRGYVDAKGDNWDLVVKSIPRMALQRLSSVDPSFLSSRDIKTAFLLAGAREQAMALSQSDKNFQKSLDQGLTMQSQLQSFTKPTRYDGLLGKQKLETVTKAGKISPTSLELYGLCPFRYYATRLLGLEKPEEENLEEIMAADKRGSAIHDMLEMFYEKLINQKEKKRPGTKPLPETFPESIFEDIFTNTIGSLKNEDLNLHPVLWEATKINLKEILREFLKDDYAECLLSGFNPIFLEYEHNGHLPEPLDTVSWTGKIDRIDQKGADIRVLDYKSGKNKYGKVVTAALRGFKLQAPLYLLFAESLFESIKLEIRSLSFVYLYMAGDEDRVVLTSDEWVVYREALIKTIKEHLLNMEAGLFVITPGAHCSYCEVKSVCRVNHSVSVYRSRNGEAEKLWTMREAKPVSKKLKKAGEA